MSSPSSSANNESRGRTSRQRISQMTPAQLERKRAQDRLSQRATRARTRQHILRLEQEIHQLRVAMAAEPISFDTGILQDLHLRNQALREEVARLQDIAAAGRGLTHGHQPGEPEMNPPLASLFTEILGSEMPSQSQSHPQPQPQSPDTCHCCVIDPALSAQHSEPQVPSQGQYAASIERQAEFLAPESWNNSSISFDMPTGSTTSQAAYQHTPSHHRGSGDSGTQGSSLWQAPQSQGQYGRRSSSDYVSLDGQQIDLPLNWDTPDTARCGQWQ